LAFGTTPSRAADDGVSPAADSRPGIFELLPPHGPFVEIVPGRLSRDPTTQFKGGRFRFGSLLPVAAAAALDACAAPAFPLRSPRSALIFVRRLRFDALMTSSTVGGRPLPVGGDFRLIFIRIPRSTIVAWWPHEADIFCRGGPCRSAVDGDTRRLCARSAAAAAVASAAAAVGQRLKSIKPCRLRTLSSSQRRYFTAPRQ